MEARPESSADRHAGPPLSAADAVVGLLILLAGACALVLCSRIADFVYDDVFYAEAGRSLVERGFYGIQGRPEANQPPGLPLLLGLLCRSGACTHLAFVRAMVVCATAGLVAAYALLRREAPRPVAAIACIAIATGAPWLELSTRYTFPCFPFLVTSMLALLAMQRLEGAEGARSRAGWTLASCALVAASILLASVGIALVGAAVARIALTLLRDRRLALARLKAFAPVVLAGLAVQGAWMQRKPPPLEWPEVPGYPASYVAQLKVKDGNQPELGYARARDLPLRIAKNLFGRAKMLAQLIVGSWLRDLWISSVILGTLLLLAIGWGRSALRSGGALHDWYFAGHELVYLLWPWKTELRFFVAVAPLGCLYLWRGAGGLQQLAARRPRALGAAWLCLSLLALTAATRIRLRGVSGSPWHGAISIGLWVLSAGLAAALLVRGEEFWAPQARWRTWLGRRGALAAAATVAGILFAWHLEGNVRIGRENLHPPAIPPPDVEAALWVRDHTPGNSVILARHVPIAHTVSGRDVVWFPPLSDPETLMRGILRHHVSFVALGDSGGEDYYLPPDYQCFARLFAAYPRSFQVAFENERFAVYRVTEGPSAGRAPARQR